MSEEKVVFRKWEEWCLLKLKEIGRSTMNEWGKAMGYEFGFNMNKVIKNNIDKLKITKTNTSRLKHYEVKEDVYFKED